MRASATRLASSHIHVWANTWTRRVEVDLDKDGRLSVVVKDGDRLVVDVELPSEVGQFANAFPPTVKTVDGIGNELIREVK